MNPQPTIDAMRTAARALTMGDLRERLRAIQTAQDALDAVKAETLAELEISKDFEIDGASTLNTWVRNELRLSAKDATTLVRASATLAALPLVGAAASAGLIRADHVNVFTYGLKHIGLEVMTEFEEVLVEVAKDHEPNELFATVRELRDRLFPDELDKSWLDGQDKEDLQVNPVPDGFHVSGFLNPVTGAKFKTLLDSVSAPRDAEDTRTGAERRVQGFEDVLTGLLNGGLPSDKGVRPHVSVVVDADTFEAAEHVQQMHEQPHRHPAPMPDVKPANMTGFGPIGPSLLMYLACVSDFTAFLVKNGHTQSQILNVGRAHRDPTLKQRRAILVRQSNICAAPGCKHTHLEIHHTIFWAHGGPTDLDLMIGLCVRCHHLLHRGYLHITGNAVDGFNFTNRHGLPIRRRRRTRYTPAA